MHTVQIRTDSRRVVRIALSTVRESLAVYAVTAYSTKPSFTFQVSQQAQHMLRIVRYTAVQQGSLSTLYIYTKNIPVSRSSCSTSCQDFSVQCSRVHTVVLTSCLPQLSVVA
jgi:hypothetical protein